MLSTIPAACPTQANSFISSADIAPAMIESFERKPEKTTPQIASQQTTNTPCVQGSFLRRPPMMVMSPEPLMACITEPAQRNSPALKKACVKRWKMPPS